MVSPEHRRNVGLLLAKGSGPYQAPDGDQASALATKLQMMRASKANFAADPQCSELLATAVRMEAALVAEQEGAVNTQ